MLRLSLLLDRFRRARGRIGAAGALAAAFGLLAQPAGARIETLRWQHPDAQTVDGFRVYTRSVDGGYGDPLFDGKPLADSAGVFAFALNVADDATVVVAVTAYTGSVESVRSNEKQLDRLASTGPAPDPSRTSVRLNAGGGSHTDASGQLWEPDIAYVSGGTAALDSGLPIQGTSTPELFHSNRYDDDPASAMTYQIPLAAGRYAVRIHTVETWEDMVVGQRVFDIAMEGAVVAANFDVLAAAGAWAVAHVQEFEVSVGDGSLTIEFLSDVLYPTVAAIEVSLLSAEPPPDDGGSGGTGGTGGTGGDPPPDGSGSGGDPPADDGGSGGTTTGAPGQPKLVR